MGDAGSRWALSALFAVTGVWYLVCLTRQPAPRAPGSAGRGYLVGAGLHVATSAAMIAMLWPWGTRFPAIAEVTVFTAGAAWYAGTVLFGGDALGLRTAGWYHAAMMAAMVWVAMLMSAPGATATGVGGSASTASMAGMAGMSGMAGMTSMPNMVGMPGTGMAGMTASWAGGVCLVLAAGFFAAAAWFGFAAVRPLAEPGPLRLPATLPHNTVSALMAAGMAVALLEMT